MLQQKSRKRRHLRSLLLIVLMLSFSLVTVASAQEAAQSMTQESALIGEHVRVNQVGYLPDQPKIAVVTAEAESFDLRNTRTGEVVLSGTLGEATFDEASGDTVRHADFSAWQTAGRYVLEIPGVGASYPFDISTDVYRRAMLDTARSYTLQRSVTDINDPLTGLSFRAGHSQDSEARLYFSDEFHDEGDPIDVSGGWYDAGDYGMYMPPSAVTVAQLMLAYEFSPDSFYRGQMLFPHDIDRTYGDSLTPDLLLETRFNLEWMEKMQRPDGAVYHKNSGLRWPGFILPEQDVQTRYVFGLSTFSTALYAGSMAMAARVYAEHEPEFAARALESARLAHEYLEANPAAFFRQDEGQDSGSGTYSKNTDREERFWAAAELLKTTGEASYDLYLRENFADLLTSPPSFISWADASALGQWAYITSEAADPATREEVQAQFIAYAQEILETIEADGYNNALTVDEYTWASAKNAVAKGNILLMANRLEPDDRYLPAALDQLHYILGRNATGYSYLTGAGSRTPWNPHHRIRASTNTYVPGLLVGGPNRYGGDPSLEAFLSNENPAPARAYLDIQDSWATNEYAIDYTAPAFFALAYFNNLSPSVAVSDTDAEPVEVGTAAAGDIISDFSDLAMWGSYSDAASTIAYSSAPGMSEERQAMLITYTLSSSGWMGISTGIDSDWRAADGLRFNLQGEGSGNRIRLELRDADNVIYESIITDDTAGWRELDIPFAELNVRQDYQPEGVNPDPAAPINLSHIQSIGFSPLSPGSGTLSLSDLRLY